MKVENQVRPGPEQMKAFLEGSKGPVCMVNLLKFRDKAQYADGRETNLSGEEAYRLYGNEMAKLVEASGGSIRFSGQVVGLLLGEVEELWDMVAIAEYPDPSALVKIASTPEFQEIEKHREAGLAGQLNITTQDSLL